jgi:hypothetical protein
MYEQATRSLEEQALHADAVVHCGQSIADCVQDIADVVRDMPGVSADIDDSQAVQRLLCS